MPPTLHNSFATHPSLLSYIVNYLALRGSGTILQQVEKYLYFHHFVEVKKLLKDLYSKLNLY